MLSTYSYLLENDYIFIIYIMLEYWHNPEFFAYLFVLENCKFKRNLPEKNLQPLVLVQQGKRIQITLPHFCIMFLKQKTFLLFSVYEVRVNLMILTNCNYITVRLTDWFSYLSIKINWFESTL